MTTPDHDAIWTEIARCEMRLEQIRYEQQILGPTPERHALWHKIYTREESLMALLKNDDGSLVI